LISEVGQMEKLPKICALLLAFGSTACTATMVNLPGGSAKRSAYAPVNEATPSAGLIKYTAHGSPSAIKARREDAYRQMFTACGGGYKIDGEGPRQEGGLAVPAAEGAPPAASQYWFIQFSCVPKSTGGLAAGPEDGTIPAPVSGPRTSPDPR
jgi:hypothetical protein